MYIISLRPVRVGKRPRPRAQTKTRRSRRTAGVPKQRPEGLARRNALQAVHRDRVDGYAGLHLCVDGRCKLYLYLYLHLHLYQVSAKSRCAHRAAVLLGGAAAGRARVSVDRGGTLVDLGPVLALALALALAWLDAMRCGGWSPVEPTTGEASSGQLV